MSTIAPGLVRCCASLPTPYLTQTTNPATDKFPEEYKKLYEAARKRPQERKRKGFNWEAEQLHDFVLFAVNIGLRPDEAWLPVAISYHTAPKLNRSVRASTLRALPAWGPRCFSPEPSQHLQALN